MCILTDEEIRKKSLLGFAKTLGISDEKVAVIASQFSAIDDLRQALSKELDHLAYHATDGGIHYANKQTAIFFSPDLVNRPRKDAHLELASARKRP